MVFDVQDFIHSVNMMGWAKENGYALTRRVSNLAAKAGNVEV